MLIPIPSMSILSRVSKSELVDLSLSLIALIIAFSIVGGRKVPGFEVIMVSAIGAGSGFLLHELAHKFVAQKYGYWAEYRANKTGLIFMIVAAFMGILFAAPGAVWFRKDDETREDVHLYGDGSISDKIQKERREQLWIALAGPMTNIALTIFFFLILISGVLTSNLGYGAAYYAIFINLTLAAFNLLPFGPLDGAKVFSASRTIWAVVSVPTIIAALPVYFGVI